MYYFSNVSQIIVSNLSMTPKLGKKKNIVIIKKNNELMRFQISKIYHIKLHGKCLTVSCQKNIIKHPNHLTCIFQFKYIYLKLLSYSLISRKNHEVCVNTFDWELIQIFDFLVTFISYEGMTNWPTFYDVAKNAYLVHLSRNIKNLSWLYLFL